MKGPTTLSTLPDDIYPAWESLGQRWMVGYGDTHDQVVVQSDTIGWTVIISVRMLSYQPIAGSGGSAQYSQCSAQMLSILLTSIKSVRFLSRTLTFQAETDPDYHFPTFVELRLSYRHSYLRFLRHCGWQAFTNVSRRFGFLLPTNFSIATHSLIRNVIFLPLCIPSVFKL